MQAIEQAYRDAYAIAYVGASNPVAVARTIADTIVRLRDNASMTYPHRHVTVRAMVGHLSYLAGMGLGPEIDDLREIRERHELQEARDLLAGASEDALPERGSVEGPGDFRMEDDAPIAYGREYPGADTYGR